MTQLTLTPELLPESSIDRIADAIISRGYIILADILPITLVDALFIDYQAIDRACFTRAGIGREEDYQLNQFVRTDEICWVDQSTPAVSEYLSWIELLRLGLNKRLFIGLFDYECQYAYYPEGAFYKKHLDAFKGCSNRVISTVTYLNPNWTATDGGELLLFNERDEMIESIMPLYGTMVIFLSERFPHEVNRARKPRRSITGWYRINTSSSERIDPPD